MTIINLPSFQAEPARHGCRSETVIAVSPLGADWAAALLTIGAPLHLYKQLKYAYGLARFSALWRFFVLLFLILIVQTLFLQALLVVGAL